MPTDPFVPERLEDQPRQEPNLAPGVKMPPARSWRANRPGDLPAGQPLGPQMGVPGPNVGYALTLARRVRDRLALDAHEHVEDALAVVGEVAMKRAAALGRAPVIGDVDVAARLLGYDGSAPAEFVAWRVRAVHGAHDDYHERRALVDAVDVDILRLVPQRLGEHIDDVRRSLQSAVPGVPTTGTV